MDSVKTPERIRNFIDQLLSLGHHGVTLSTDFLVIEERPGQAFDYVLKMTIQQYCTSLENQCSRSVEDQSPRPGPDLRVISTRSDKIASDSRSFRSS